MTKRERVLAALNHQESDIIPYTVGFVWQEHEIIAKYLNDPAFDKKIANHIQCSEYMGWPEEMPDRAGYFKDEFGVIWNRAGVDKDIGVLDNYVIDLENNTYKFPPVNEKRLRADHEEAMANRGDCFIMGEIGFSLFERAWTLCGMENVLASMLTNPNELHELMEQICERNLKIIDIALEFDIDGMHLGDDWGQQKGTIMGAKHWRTFIKPYMKRMIERAKTKVKYVSLHSCGDISELLPDLIDIGLDCYQTVQPEIYDLEWLKKEYGKDMSFWGAISTQRILSQGTPEAVRDVTIDTLRIMGKGGGYIAGATHAVPADVPPENAMAMIEVFENQDKYL